MLEETNWNTKGKYYSKKKCIGPWSHLLVQKDLTRVAPWNQTNNYFCLKTWCLPSLQRPVPSTLKFSSQMISNGKILTLFYTFNQIREKATSNSRSSIRTQASLSYYAYKAVESIENSSSKSLHGFFILWEY